MSVNLALHHLGFSYPGGVVALRDVSLEVARGECVALVGRSGSGKSTLLKLCNGLLHPEHGEIRFDGTSIVGADLVTLRRRIGYVVQQIGLFPHLTVAQNIGLLGRAAGWSTARQRTRVMELLELIGLDAAQYASRYPHQLSGGEQQRVGIARALFLDPQLLLLDEAFGALDPVTRTSLQREFLQLRRELTQTILWVTHARDEAFAMGQRIAVMHHGELLQVGTRAALEAAPPTSPVGAWLAGGAS